MIQRDLGDGTYANYDEPVPPPVPVKVVWTEARMCDSFCWTSPEFPGYEIEKHDDEPLYRVFAPVGPIGVTSKFAYAVQHVKDDKALVDSAAQVRKDYDRAVREAAAELGCDESEIF